MQICEEQFLRNGMLEEMRSKMVGMDTPALRRAFANNRVATEKRLDAGETESLTIKETYRIGRNDLCPCGSQLKFKKCCGSRLAANDSRIAD